MCYTPTINIIEEKEYSNFEYPGKWPQAADW